MIQPRISEFSHHTIPIHELAAFYALPNNQPSTAVKTTAISIETCAATTNAGLSQIDLVTKTKRPYTWSNSVVSMDGILHFKEHDSHVSDVALKSVSEEGSRADFRLLNGGWAHADAVLISGQILRDEPTSYPTIKFDDLIDYRMKSLKYPTSQPIQLILTQSCNIHFHHPIFHQPGIRVVILTSMQGKQHGEGCLKELYSNHAPVSDIRIVSFPCLNHRADHSYAHGCLPLDEIVEWLYAELGIRYLDVSAGGNVIRQMLDMGLLDEIRMTQTGQIAGCFNSIGEERPTLFPRHAARVRNYTSTTSPVVSWKGIRVFGEHFIFLRGVVDYRHLK